MSVQDKKNTHPILKKSSLNPGMSVPGASASAPGKGKGKTSARSSTPTGENAESASIQELDGILGAGGGGATGGGAIGGAPDHGGPGMNGSPAGVGVIGDCTQDDAGLSREFKITIAILEKSLGKKIDAIKDSIDNRVAKI